MSNHIYKFRFNLFGFPCCYFHCFEVVRNDALAVKAFDFNYPVNGERIMFGTIRKGVPHQVFEYIFFNQVGIAFGNLDLVAIIREMLQCIQVGIQFIVQATFETAALATQFCLVDGQVLVTGSSGVY